MITDNNTNIQITGYDFLNAIDNFSLFDSVVIKIIEYPKIAESKVYKKAIIHFNIVGHSVLFSTYDSSSIDGIIQISEQKNRLR